MKLEYDQHCTLKRSFWHHFTNRTLCFPEACRSPPRLPLCRLCPAEPFWFLGVLVLKARFRGLTENMRMTTVTAGLICWVLTVCQASKGKCLISSQHCDNDVLSLYYEELLFIYEELIYKLEAKSGLNAARGDSKGPDTSPIRSKQSIRSFPENIWGMYSQGSCSIIKWVRKPRIIKVLIPRNKLAGKKTPLITPQMVTLYENIVL